MVGMQRQALWGAKAARLARGRCLRAGLQRWVRAAGAAGRRRRVEGKVLARWHRQTVWGAFGWWAAGGRHRRQVLLCVLRVVKRSGGVRVRRAVGTWRVYVKLAREERLRQEYERAGNSVEQLRAEEVSLQHECSVVQETMRHEQAVYKEEQAAYRQQHAAHKHEKQHQERITAALEACLAHLEDSLYLTHATLTEAHTEARQRQTVEAKALDSQEAKRALLQAEVQHTAQRTATD